MVPEYTSRGIQEQLRATKTRGSAPDPTEPACSLAFSSVYWRAPPREGLAERFAFQKLHGDVGRAVIGLAGFVNGDDVRVINAPRGSRFILKAQQEADFTTETQRSRRTRADKNCGSTNRDTLITISVIGNAHLCGLCKTRS